MDVSPRPEERDSEGRESPKSCSLAQARPGAMMKVTGLDAPADVAIRLRELGFCEQQRVRVLSRHTNVICQVCNVRLGISRDLARMIVVEPAAPLRPPLSSNE